MNPAASECLFHLACNPSFSSILRAARSALKLPVDGVKGAILINTSRAEAVNLQSLVKALQEGTLGGYGADVLWNEPPDSPLEKELIAMDNVMITPHIGAQTHEAQGRVARITLENMLKAMEEISG